MTTVHVNTLSRAMVIRHIGRKRTKRSSRRWIRRLKRRLINRIPGLYKPRITSIALQETENMLAWLYGKKGEI